MTRAEMLERVRSGPTWDVVIIGGGATGLGTALDAVTRGYRTLLLEAHDFAKATSSRSTKLVHGGVRYLGQGRIGLVHESLHERGILRKNAPHLVHDLPFVVPAYDRWSRVYYGVGLKVYDLLAGRLGFGASHSIGPSEALERIPTLRPDGLRGGTVYFDGQFDDARLAIALWRTTVDLGGIVLNYVPAIGLIRDGGRLRGVVARDAETGEEFTIAARTVVNATGVFADDVRRLDEPSAPPMLAPSQGIHVVLDRSFLPGNSAMLIPQTDDGRVLFAIPWHGKVLLGTTDTPVEHPEIEPRPHAEEVDYLLEHAGRYLSVKPRRSDILSQFAGLRPLVKSGHPTESARLSREHVLTVSASGLITITGGKWTTYRRMAADTVDKAAEVGELPGRPCVTSTWQLHGWTSDPGSGPFSTYGSDLPILERLIAERPEWGRLIHPRLPQREGEVVWAAREEMARTVEDVLSRRTRALVLDARAALEAAPLVAELLAGELGRDPTWQDDQVREFSELCRGYIPDPS